MSIYVKQVFFIIGSILILFICACPSNNKPSNAESLPSQIISDFKLFESSSGFKLYSVDAVKAYVYSHAQKIDVDNPYIIFYNEDGSISSKLNSLHGIVNTKNSNLFAKDSVLVQTNDSTILHTDSLIWDNQAQIITTDAWVTIESKQGLIQGQGLISDAGLKKIEIKSSVTGKSEYDFK
jgi:LPS export ABC transporter protein LptC